MLKIVIPFAALVLSQQSQAQPAAAPSKLTRDGARRITLVGHTVEAYSSGSGTLEQRLTPPVENPIRDFDLDSTGALYLLETVTGAIVKWRPQSAGADFRLTDFDGQPVTAVAVDSDGTRLFAAVGHTIWMFDALRGNLLLKGAQALKSSIGRLRFDDETSTLHAEGKGLSTFLPLTLDSASSFAAATRVLPALYPVGFEITPRAQSSFPGGTVHLRIATLTRATAPPVAAYNLTVDSPVAGTLQRNVLHLDDAVSYTIQIPANQPPGVYRVVAKLDNGANGYASAVFIIPFANATNIEMFGTGMERGGTTAHGLVDRNYRIVNPIDDQCQNAWVAFAHLPPVGTHWDTTGGSARWISGQANALQGCLPGLHRFRTDIDLREFDPATANIAVAVWADNAVHLEINGVAIAAEPQEIGEPEAFRVPRVYGIPRSALRLGTNALDFIVRNDALSGAIRNPMGLRVEVLHATAVPNSRPDPPPVGDFWLTSTPPFQFVFGTTARYNINVEKVGGFVGTPRLSINILPPTGYSATFNGNELTVTRDPNVTTAPQAWRFAVVGMIGQTTRSVDIAFIQNPLPPVDIPLFSTGMVNATVPAAANSVDTHYTLAASPDPAFPGPAARVADELTSPIGPWVLNDQFSKWISPRADANANNAPGLYRYTTTFDLGLGAPGQAAIAIRWASDNQATVLLNGTVVASLENPGNFRRMNEALITEGFRPGVNTLEFAVTNLDLGGASPTGLRVQVLRAQSSRNPNRVVQVLRGQSSIGPVPLVNSTFSHNAPGGVTITSNGTNLVFAASDAAPLGMFPIRITFAGGGTSMDVLLVIGARQAVSYIVNSTGQSDEGSIDPNYRLIESADPLYPGPAAWTIFSNTSPISLGFWTPNTINSRWIAPRRDAVFFNAPGTYRYRTTFDLTGRNINTAVLGLEWAADNRGRIELNGVVQDRIDTPDGFRAMRPVSITSGFRPGVNHLEFVVVNDGVGNQLNPTGLHVNVLGAWAVSQGTGGGPDYTLTPDPGVITVAPGQTGQFTVRIVPNFLFDQFVTFSIVEPPSGFTFVFDPPTARFSTTLRVTPAPGARAGRYPIRIRGRWGDIIREETAIIDVPNILADLVVPSTGGADPGLPDPAYTLIDGSGAPLPAFVADPTNPNVFWPGNWITIGSGRSISGPAGSYRFRMSFDATGYNPATIVINGRWDASDQAVAIVNGAAPVALDRAIVGFPGVLRLNSGFVSGVNTIDFVVTNRAAGPVGLMVQVQSVTGTP